MALMQVFDAEAAYPTGGYEAPAGDGSFNASSPISGLYDMRLVPVGTGVAYCPLDKEGWDTSTWNAVNGLPGVGSRSANSYVSFRLKVNALPTATERIMRMLDYSAGTNKGYLQLRSDGKIEVLDSSATVLGMSTAALSAGNTYRIDWYVPSGTGASILRINESAPNGFTSAGSAFWGGSDGAHLYIGKAADVNGSGYDLQFDDIVVDDSAFVPANYQCTWLRPNAVGSTAQFVSSAGGAAVPADVNEQPWGSGNWSESTAIGNVQLFALDNCSTKGISGTILGAQYLLWAANATAGCLFKPRVKSGATVLEPATADDPLSRTRYNRTMPVDPATGLAWTISALDALEVGASEFTGSLGRLQLHACGVIVVHTTVSVPTLVKKFQIPTTAADGTTRKLWVYTDVTCTTALVANQPVTAAGGQFKFTSSAGTVGVTYPAWLATFGATSAEDATGGPCWTLAIEE